MNDYNKNIKQQPDAPALQNQDLMKLLKSIVGKTHVLHDAEQTRRFRTGFRFGGGAALAVVKPGSLIEQWRVVKACVESNKIVIMQAANTGLTGGSAPSGDDYDREVVIINTLRIKTIQVINDGHQVICLPGSTLDQLEKLLKPLGREPHSVIGSSCIGASVLGGVCNNSGGSLVKRGPAYTEMAIFARLEEDGVLSLVNHLGVSLGSDPEEILGRLERGEYRSTDVFDSGRRASDDRYATHVREVEADTAARFNADPSRLHEASGSAGRMSVFAVRLDTFPAEVGAKVFYIGTNSTQTLAKLRKSILTDFTELPIAGEYIHRDAYDIAQKYGKDMFLTINHLGTHRVPAFFALKNSIDDFCRRVPILPSNLADRVLQGLSTLFPSHLPKRMGEYRQQYEHHLLLKVSGAQEAETSAFLEQFFALEKAGRYFECTSEEGRKAFLHRFAAAGAAVRYRAVHPAEVEDIVALDIALRRNDQEWFEVLPQEAEDKIIKKLYYGHFLCHVFHQDYIVRKGTDCVALEHDMLSLLDVRGAQYPAEHNVGHLYKAPPPLQKFYRELDPCNQFNPGIGMTSKCGHWK